MVSPLVSRCQFQPDIYLLGAGDEDAGKGGRHAPQVRCVRWPVGLMVPVPGPDGKSAPLVGGWEETFSQGSSLFYQSSVSKETSSHFQLAALGKYQRGWVGH